jgi:hypothetical protein
MSTPQGFRRSLPESRRLVNDLLRYAARTPLVPVERWFELADLADLRSSMSPKISWPVLFIKAYGLLCGRHAHLRQAYMSWPRPHLYEHPCSVAMLAINRSQDNEDRLFWGRFWAPETCALVELQAELDRYKYEPVESAFRRQLRFARFPSPLRRIAWSLTLNFGSKRAKRLGTFGISTLAGLGAYNRHHPSCLTTSLSYGPIDSNGKSLVTILFDHRVVDGAMIARNLAELETILKGTIATELHAMANRLDEDAAVKRAA